MCVVLLVQRPAISENVDGAFSAGINYAYDGYVQLNGDWSKQKLTQFPETRKICIVSNLKDDLIYDQVSYISAMTKLFSELSGENIELTKVDQIGDCDNTQKSVVRIGSAKDVKDIFAGDLSWLTTEDRMVQSQIDNFVESHFIDSVQIFFGQNEKEKIVDYRYAFITNDSRADKNFQKFLLLHEMNHFFTLRLDVANYKSSLKRSPSINEYLYPVDLDYPADEILEKNADWWNTSAKGLCRFDIMLLTTVGMATAHRAYLNNLEEFYADNWNEIETKSTEIYGSEKFQEIIYDC